MVSIAVTSLSPFSGKAAVTVGLAAMLQAEGRKVGYFKPLGPLVVREGETLADEDAVFIKRVLGLREPLEVLCPVVLNNETISLILRGGDGELKERILPAYAEASRGKDVTFVVSMGDLSCGQSLGCPMSSLAGDIGAKVVIVDRYNWPLLTLDGLLAMKETLGDRLAGVIFNKVAPSDMPQIVEDVTPFLRSRGVEVLGSIPLCGTLNAVAVRDLVDALDGKVLCCGDRLDDLAEHICIGAMNPDAALRFFQSMGNKVVITGGDRSDIQITALETSTRCLVLTGGLYPCERILTRAGEAGIPVVLAKMETASAARACEEVKANMGLHSDKKVLRILELMKTHLDREALRRAVGV